MMDTTTAEVASANSTRYSLWQLVRYMLALGTWGFGGPVALAGYMYRDLVERRGWISDSDYKEGLALAQLMPGPWQRSLRSISATCTTACSAQPWSEPAVVIAAALIGLLVHPIVTRV